MPNPYDDFFQRERDDKMRVELQLAPPPAEVARTTRVARNAGLPPVAVEDRLDDYDLAQNVDSFISWYNLYPAARKYMLANPRAAATAQGDHKPLGILSSEFNVLRYPRAPSGFQATPQDSGWADGFIGGIKKLPQTARWAGAMLSTQGAKMNYAAADAYHAVTYPFNALVSTGLNALSPGLGGDPDREWTDSQKYWQRGIDAAAGRERAAQPKFSGATQQGLLSGVAQLPSSIIALGSGVLARNPNVSLGMMGVQTSLPAYTDARIAGKGILPSLTYGAEQGAIEVLTEKIPAGDFIKAVTTKTPFGRMILTQLAEEIPGEQVATFFQDMAEWTTLHPDKSVNDFIAERPSAAAQTLLQTLSGTAMQTGVVHAATTAPGAVTKLVGRARDAREARQEAKSLDRMALAATDSNTRKLDPVAFHGTMDALAEDSGATHVYIDGQAAREYMQSDGFDNDWLAGHANEVNDAADSGQDFALPVSDALTHLAPTPAWAALKDDMRLTAGGMSAREAQDFADHIDDHMAELTDKIEAQDKADAAQRTVREKLVDDIAVKLGDSYTAPAARDMAEVAAAYLQRRAERLGMELDGSEFDHVTIQQVMPEALGRVLEPAIGKPAEIDAATKQVIKAIRGNSTVKTGPSLIDWIASKGGVEDKGGNIKAMGAVGVKARAGKGQRKIIKPHRGADMLAGDNHNPNSLEAMFNAAISDGYFPDLLANREADDAVYADLADTNDFLAAISEGLAGRHTYSVDHQGTEQDHIQEAADELRQLLQEAGYDPDSMSDAAVRDAMDVLYQAQGGGLEQELFNDPAQPERTTTQEQRAEMEARLKQAMIRRGGQKGVGDQAGGLFDSSRDQGSLLQEARGSIQFNQGEVLIQLFQSRNLSTFTHEFGHMALENLRADAELNEAPDGLKGDWKAVQAWFKANGHPITDTIPTEAHELWARGFERYIMEGKAPSTGLKRIFETMRGWMLSIYKTVDALRSPITPEIREVMDRLLASDEEIAAVREMQNIAALFKDAASIGMNEGEFAGYQRQVEDAKAEANSALIDKTMQVFRRRETKRYTDARRTLRDEVEADVNDRPLFRALRNLRTNPMDTGWIKEEIGDEALSLLPKRVPPVHKPSGMDPALVAELSGFSTGKQMIEALITAELEQQQAKEGGDARPMRARIIDTITDEEMNRREGDPLNDGSIEREALAAVYNDMEGEVIATEARVLARKTGQRATPYAVAKQWAREKVRTGKVNEEASPAAIQRHARNAAKAARVAEAAFLKQDRAEAFRQKQFQMLNNALLSEAKQAHDEVQSAVKRLARVAKAKTIKAVDQDYLEQAQALLEEVDLRKRSQVSLTRKASFEKWAQAKLESAGEEVYIPERFDYQGTNWTRLPVETLLGLDDTVKSIIHLGRRKQELKLGKEKRDWNEARGQWLGRADALPERTASTDRNAKRNRLRGLFSNFVRIDMTAKVMDGGDPNGLMTRVLSYGSKEADNTFARIRQEVLQPIVDHYMGMKGNRLTERVAVPEWTDYRTGGPSTFLRSDLIAIALNLGSESNLRKMLAGEALLFKDQEHLAPTLAGVEGMLARELNESEWGMVKLAWERVNSMWPEIVADERERSGIEPEKVEPRMVQTPFGEIEGGYWPAAYDTDPVRMAAAGVHLAELKAGDIETVLGLTGKGVGTAKGHTVTRTDFVAPMFLNLEGVLFGHVDQVAKRIAYQAWGTQALKVIRDPRIKAMWARKLGEEYHAQLEPWLRDTINQGVVANTGHLADFNGILKQTRMNLTIMGLVGRITTLFAQVGGLTSSANAIGAKNMANGLAICAANYGENKRKIYDASPLMNRRIDEFDRDQAAALAELSRPRTAAAGKALKPLTDMRDRWNALGFHAIGAVQLHLVDLPTWAGAYAQATGASDNGGLDMDHDAAVDYADLKVEQAQGAGRAAQLAAVQRAGEATKIMTLFYTFFGTQLNYQWEMTQDVRAGNYGKAVKSAFWIMVATPLIAGLLGDAIRGDLPDDDDTWLAWMMRKVFFGMFTGVPIVRDFANTAERKAAGKYTPSPETPWQRVASGIGGGAKDAFAGISQTDWYQDAERIAPMLPDPEEVSDKWIKHSLEALGFATGFGLGQVATTTQFAVDVHSGKAQPQTLGDYAQGVATGKVKE